LAVATYAVTGAFGFSGRHIARRPLDRGDAVRNLTNHPDRPDPFGGRVACAPLALDDPRALAEALAGVDVLVNTYWVRYDHGGADHALAVERSGRLFRAAAEAGVRRIVHVSIANPDAASPLTYYRGKAAVEAALAAAGPSYGIVRPTVLFGDNPILPNTIAYLLRRLPVFGIPGDGRYGIQPVAVEDLADLAIELADDDENRTIDAVGPEIFTFREFVTAIRDAIGSRAVLLPTPVPIALAAAGLLGRALGDVILTRQELDGLMAGLLVSREPALGRTRFSDWLTANAGWLGQTHLSELAAHFDAAPSGCRLAAALRGA
jgi:NADH dehydrogenase